MEERGLACGSAMYCTACVLSKGNFDPACALSVQELQSGSKIMHKKKHQERAWVDEGASLCSSFLSKGSRLVREGMLRDFVAQCETMTAPELEQQFSDCASLFLARLTAWLRLT